LVGKTTVRSPATAVEKGLEPLDELTSKSDPTDVKTKIKIKILEVPDSSFARLFFWTKI
jgi:hypothetical protein